MMRDLLLDLLTLVLLLNLAALLLVACAALSYRRRGPAQDYGTPRPSGSLSTHRLYRTKGDRG